MSEIQFPFLFDGAMSTCFFSEHPSVESGVEEAMMEHPEWIEKIHRDYVKAGAKGIKTNTFSLPSMIMDSSRKDQALKIMDQAIESALKAAKKDTVVFGDLGPVSGADPDKSIEIYGFLIEEFLKRGIDHILIETLAEDPGLQKIAAEARKRGAKLLAVSFAIAPDGFSSLGHSYTRLLKNADDIEAVDWIGLNCQSGPYHLYKLIQGLKPLKKPLMVMPNAGYPAVLGRHIHYGGSPDYFADSMTRLLDTGISAAGGCCGTTPLHIAALKKVMDARSYKAVNQENNKEQENTGLLKDCSGFWKKLEARKKIIAVEIDPPASDQIAPFMESAGMLKHMGADLITIADCPVGRPRADSSLLACKIKREVGIQVLPHMTCRDRNLNAAKALLMGLSIEDIHNVLAITGDPLPTSDFSEVKTVYSYNSRKFAGYIHQLAADCLSMDFNVFGALNLNARNFDQQLRIAKEKQKAGMCGFLCQPIHSKEAFENLKKARKELDSIILAGIYPIVSKRNALFMNNEINGIHVCDEIIDLYEGLDRDEAEKMAEKISVETARQAADYCDGFYIMTPFNRLWLVQAIIEKLQKDHIV